MIVAAFVTLGVAVAWLLMAWGFARVHASRVVLPPPPVIPPLVTARLERFGRAVASIGISAAEATEGIRAFADAWNNAAPSFRPRSDTPKH